MYDRIKIVNFLRAACNVEDPTSFLRDLSFDADSKWRSENYLIPTIENDGLLIDLGGDVDEDDEEDWSDDEFVIATHSGSSVVFLESSHLIHTQGDVIEGKSIEELHVILRKQRQQLLELRMTAAKQADDLSRLREYSQLQLVGVYCYIQ